MTRCQQETITTENILALILLNNLSNSIKFYLTTSLDFNSSTNTILLTYQVGNGFIPITVPP